MIQPGDTIGPYTLIRALGRGAFGEVWLADKRSALVTSQFALKLPFVTEADFETVRQEAVLWQQASGHPNIVPVIEADIYDGQIVIASEYIAGGTLHDWMQANPSASVEEALVLVNGILSGLDYLHRAGLTHRDLKPENVLLQDGIPRLTDFGLARVLKSVGNTSTISGTPRYMAPETFSGDYSAASDLWAVGIILYELLAGFHPFPTDKLMALISAIQNQSPALLPETIPDRLSAIVTRLLAKFPEARFASHTGRTAASAAREALQNSLAPGFTSHQPPTTNHQLNNLPVQPTSFIGREREVAEIKSLLEQTHLLTLTGSGGCGKTRLSLKVAEELQDRFPDGVWFVELAPLFDPGLVPQTVATVLGIREAPGEPIETTLVSALKAKRLLLVLDNCEHLLDASARLADTVLRSCPEVRFLVSSRESLGIAGENAYRVPSLSLPDLRGTNTPESISRYESIRLFVERATAAKTDFQVTAQNADSLASICHRLDGIPLAIELAASRVRGMPLEQIETRLSDRFRLLTGGSRTALPRQQTLRAMIDWSYDLLEEKQKALLQRLAVFSGGWSLESAESVCCGEVVQVIGYSGTQTDAASIPNTGTPEHLNTWEVLDLLLSLSDKSLVVYEETCGIARYRLLETVRQYARDRLAESGEAEASRNRHLAHFLALAEEAEPHLTGPDQQQWLNALEIEHDNLRSALEWSVEMRGSAALHIAGALWRFWNIRGHLTEGRARLTGALALDPDRRDGARGKALNGAGVVAGGQGDYASARALHEESLAILRELGDRQGIAVSLNNLANVAWNQGDYTSARALHEENLTLRRELGDKHGIAASLNNLGNVGCNQGDYAAARTHHEESLTISRGLGDKHGIAASLNNLGNIAFEQGDYAAARTLYEESLTLKRELGDKQGAAYTLNNLGNNAYRQGDDPAARTLLEESLTIQRELEDKWGIAESLNSLGLVASSEGDYAAARTHQQESLTIKREIGDKLGITESLEAFAALAAVQNQSSRAAILWGAAEALRDQIGSPLSPADREDVDRKTAAASAALGEDAFSAVWAEGSGMMIERAIDLALQEIAH